MAIKSYKGFDKNLRCRDFQYEIGGIYEMDGKIKKMESKEYALGVERMDKEVGAPIDIAQSPMLMAAYEAGWDGA